MYLFPRQPENTKTGYLKNDQKHTCSYLPKITKNIYELPVNNQNTKLIGYFRNNQNAK